MSTTTSYPSSTRQTIRRCGFTLVELLVSIALVVVLMLGINTVFQYTSKAVGQGQAINTAVRDSRAAQSVMAQDFAAIVPNGPGSTNAACIVMRSAAQQAFRDRADEAGDQGIGPVGATYGVAYPRELTIDLNGDGKEGDPNVPGEIIPYCTYNYRNHRIDTLSFFARDKFARQTGNLGTIAADQTSQEAWIWYGHLWLPDNNGNYPFDASGNPLTFPGFGLSAGANPNNYYGSQFILGRVAILLTEKSVDSNLGLIFDNSGNSQRFLDRTNAYVVGGPPYATEVEPFTTMSTKAKTVASDTVQYLLQDSRFDVAATSISSFRDKLLSYVNPANPIGPFQPPWWDQMMSGVPNTQSSGAVKIPQPAGTRFKCNPFIGKPIDAVKTAEASPYFIRGCSQFIVEFAGDYLTQDNDPTSGTYGSIKNASTPGLRVAQGDGVLDWTLVGPPGHQTKQIIWYGYPRNTSGAPGVHGPGAGPGDAPTSNKNDVVPLRDWLQMSGWAIPAPGNFFEKVRPTFSFDYSRAPLAGGLSNNPAIRQYVCAWGPNDQAVGGGYTYPPPKLFRITITLTDDSGHLPDGLTYQYVFPVPPP
jgi:prepilin-type N-terminal cleavage/methylation domain-containing protein